MATTTVDIQIFPLCTYCNEFIMEVERTLCGMEGVRLLSVDHENVKFTIETTRHPGEIRDTLQHTFVGTSFHVSRRINNTRSSSIQGPLNFHETARELVEGSRGNGLQNVVYTRSTILRMNYNDQPSTSRSPTNVHGGHGYANVTPPPRPPPSAPPEPPSPPPPPYQATTYGPAWEYENVGGSGYVNVAPPPTPTPPPPPQRYQPSTSGSAWGYQNVGGYGYDLPQYTAEGEGCVYGYPTGDKYMKDDYYSGVCSTIIWYLFYGILILLLLMNIE